MELFDEEFDTQGQRMYALENVREAWWMELLDTKAGSARRRRRDKSICLCRQLIDKGGNVTQGGWTIRNAAEKISLSFHLTW